MEGMVEPPKNVEIEEAEEAVEEVPRGGVRASGHGLEVSPSSLLDQAISNGDFGAAGLGWRVGLRRVHRRGR